MHFNRINDAIANYRIAIQAAPKYMLAHWNLAYAFQEQGSFDDALTEYRAAIRYTTDEEQLATLHTKIGDLFREQPGENDHLENAIAEISACYRDQRLQLGAPQSWPQLARPARSTTLLLNFATP